MLIQNHPARFTYPPRLRRTFAGYRVGTGLFAGYQYPLNGTGVLTNNGSTPVGLGNVGPMWTTDGSTRSVRASLAKPFVLGTDSAVSFVLVYSNTSSTTSSVIASLGADTGSSGNTLALMRIDTTAATKLNFVLQDGSSNSAVNITSGGAVTVNVGVWHSVVLSCDLTASGSPIAFYIDGVADGTSTRGATISGNTTFGYVTAGGFRRGGTDTHSAGTFDIAMWVPIFGALDARTATSLSANPWQLFEPRPRRNFIAATSSTSYTYTGTGGAVFGGSATTSVTSAGGQSYTGTGGIVFGGAATTYTMSSNQVCTDGVWTWFNDERVRYYNGSYYGGGVTSAGDIVIWKYTPSTGAKSTYTLAAGFELDDHDNPAIFILPSGKIVAAYCKHNGSRVNVRISTNAEDIGAWGSVNYTNITNDAYANIYQCGSYYWLFFRSSASNYQDYCVRTTDFVTFGTPFKVVGSTNEASYWPYIKYCQNGSNRIDAFYNTSHPNQSTNPDLYHIYFTESGGALVPHKSDGTVLTLPVLTTSGTKVYDSVANGTSAWVWQIRPQGDGNPRVLFSRYQSTTDHRAMFSRWTGSAWTTAVEITPMGTYLYAAEPYYSGGMTFDGNNTNRVFLSKQVGSYWEIQKWETTDTGSSWSKISDITTGSTVKNCRPFSPVGHAGAAVFWWRGSYTSFTNYNTSIYTATGTVDSDNGYTYSGSGTITFGGTAGASFGTATSTSYSYEGLGGMVFAGTAAFSYTTTSRTLTVTLVDETGATLGNMTSLRWAFFDQATPDIFSAPVDKGAVEVTDGAGELLINLTSTTLQAGQTGWLIVTNSDGTTTQSPSHRCFSGPVTVQ